MHGVNINMIISSFTRTNSYQSVGSRLQLHVHTVVRSVETLLLSFYLILKFEKFAQVKHNNHTVLCDSSCVRKDNFSLCRLCRLLFVLCN